MKSIGWRVAELWPFEVFHTWIGHRRPDTGHASDSILCRTLLCSALDRQKSDITDCSNTDHTQLFMESLETFAAEIS